MSYPMENFLHYDSSSPNNSHSPSYKMENSPGDISQSPQFEEIIQDGKKRHLCLYPGCGKIFRFKSEIIRHHVIHFASRPYTCNFEGCNKSFKRPDALDSHMRIHIKDSSFNCDVDGCGMRFPTKAALKHHSAKHNPHMTSKVEDTDTKKSDEDSYSSYEPFNKNLKMEESSHRFPFYERQELMEPLKGSKFPPTSYNEFSSPAPRFATSIEWEMKNPDDLKDLIMRECRDGSENCEIIVKKILSENFLLKQKLNQCNKMMDTIDETPKIQEFMPKEVPEDIIELGTEQTQYQPESEAEQPNFFGDDSDALFLAFLKERESNYAEGIF